MIFNRYKVRLGYAPTRRNVFSREDSVRFRRSILGKLKEMNIDLVDIHWLNADGLLYDTSDVDAIVKKFDEEGVDAVFCPHCNFGTEDAVAKLAGKMGKPLLLWGPRDEAPLENGIRLRDSQCGLFATSKVLKRVGAEFTYIENCRLDEGVFKKGLEDFIAASCVVKNFRNMRIGQIGTRPGPFWSVICNEGEILEKFGIEIVPISLSEIVNLMKHYNIEKKNTVKEYADEISSRICSAGITRDELEKIAAIKLAISEWAENEKLSGAAIQCWNALQQVTGIMPCVANSELTGDGLPIACETDIIGAITSVMLQSAVLGATPTFFADLTVRHPYNDNGELLWHCGPFPYKLKKEGAVASIGHHYVLDSACAGVAEWEIKGGEITIARLDSIRGKYSMLASCGKGIDGPKNRGTYIWVEFKDWPALERKIIYGPYIHHVAAVHGNVTAILHEALRYIPGIDPDIILD